MSSDNVISIARLKGQVDETGQAVTVSIPRRKKKKGWRERVGLIDLDAMNRLELSALEYKVLFAVMSAVPKTGGSVAFITVEEVARIVGSSRPSVNRTLSLLKERRIIMRDRGSSGRLRVSPWLMFNGDFSSWNVETESEEEPVWVRGVDPVTGEVK